MPQNLKKLEELLQKILRLVSFANQSQRYHQGTTGLEEFQVASCNEDNAEAEEIRSSLPDSIML
jgi:hypothetical protein